MKNYSRFREFVQNFTRLVEQAGADEVRILDAGAELLRELVQRGEWRCRHE